MESDYLYVHKSILPDCLDGVLRAKRLLESGRSKNVSAAVKEAGISRSTFYKYKDFVMEPYESARARNAVISMLLTHESGVLNAVLSCISSANGSILTITQSLPIRGKASVTVSVDISGMNISLTDLLKKIEKTEGAENAKLVAVE